MGRAGAGAGCPAGTRRHRVLTFRRRAGGNRVLPGHLDVDRREGDPAGLYYDIVNTSHQTVVLYSVGISGPGIWTVVRPVQIMIAPLRFGWHNYEPHSVAAALYTTDPPVNYEGLVCRRQALFPLKGFRMTPGSDARFWIVVRALRPGRWVIPRHVIYYTQSGVRYRQAEPWRAYGLVAARAAYIPPAYTMAHCVGPEGARFLPGHHAGPVSG
jgi:hypothetical protein